jgi:hypothetical protein
MTTIAGTEVPRWTKSPGNAAGKVLRNKLTRVKGD